MDLTDYLAIYGAALSSVVALLNWRRSSPRVQVRVVLAAEGGKGEGLQFGVGISVQNPSSQAAHINHVGFIYPWRRVTLKERWRHFRRFKRLPFNIGWCHSSFSLNEIDSRCPVTIAPFQSHYIFVPEAAIERILKNATHREFRVEVQDALTRSTSSPIFKDVWPIEQSSASIAQQS